MTKEKAVRSASAAAVPGTDGAKEKRLRVAYRMTEIQSALLEQMKARAVRMGLATKRGELLYAGLQLLNRLSEAEFEAVIRPLLSVPTFAKRSRRNRPGSAKK